MTSLFLSTKMTTLDKYNMTSIKRSIMTIRKEIERIKRSCYEIKRWTEVDVCVENLEKIAKSLKEIGDWNYNIQWVLDINTDDTEYDYSEDLHKECSNEKDSDDDSSEDSHKEDSNEEEDSHEEWSKCKLPPK